MSIVPTTLHLVFGAISFALAFKMVLIFKRNHKENYFLHLFALTKPRLTSLVLFTTLSGMMLANHFEITLISGFLTLIGTQLIVAGSCVLNCYQERETDGLMNRTCMRALPSKKVAPFHALFFGILLLLIGLPLLLFYGGVITFVLGMIALVSYLVFYTPLKKKTPWALFIGAIPGALPPLMGHAAATKSLSSGGFLLFSLLQLH